MSRAISPGGFTRCKEKGWGGGRISQDGGGLEEGQGSTREGDSRLILPRMMATWSTLWPCSSKRTSTNAASMSGKRVYTPKERGEK